MRLRKWQRESVEQAINAYLEGIQEFSVLASPGAGKTIMSATLSKRLNDMGLIDFVLFLSPTVNVSSNVKKVFSGVLNRNFDGLFGSLGVSKTYQSLTSLNAEFWNIFDNFRVLVILDEVHHLGGQTSASANVWGREVIEKIQRRSTFILSMSGTPWRSDYKPVTTLKMDNNTGTAQCDYAYGIRDAIRDSVCRIPVINFVDNCNLNLRKDSGEHRTYGSILTLLENENCSYEQIVNNESVLKFILQTSISKLNSIRRRNKDAAGLIVASSVEHAKLIYKILRKHFDESAELVAHSLKDSLETISAFEKANSKWLVSISADGVRRYRHSKIAIVLSSFKNQNRNVLQTSFRSNYKTAYF